MVEYGMNPPCRYRANARRAGGVNVHFLLAAREGVRMDNVVLIGMPGTGKSTVGARLAQALGYTLVDTDRLMVKQYGKSLPALLAEHGVEGFLTLEGQVGAALRCQDCVIATGGSMVLSDVAMQNLRRGATVVWLDAPLEELERRIRRNADRGIAAEPGTTLASIDAVRRPLYARYADLHVQALQGVTRVTERILKELTQAGRLGAAADTDQPPATRGDAAL